MLNFIIVLICLCSYFGRYAYIFELLSHFRIQYLISISLCLIYFSIRRRWLFTAMNTIIVVILLFEIVPYYCPRNIDAEGKKFVRIYYSNVLTSNENHEGLLEQVKRENPDIIGLVEINSKWTESLAILKSSHPHHEILSREDNFGIALYSKYPLSSTKIRYFGSSWVPTITTKLEVGDRLVEFILTHPLPPSGVEFFMVRNKHYVEMSNYIEGIDRPLILVGDLNSSLWSPYYKDFMESTGLINSRMGFGVIPTWPRTVLLLRTSLDHVLVSEDISVKEFRRMEDIGSDHFPLSVSLGIK